MATVENMIERQFELFGVISRAVENLQKLGPTRTNRGTVQSRLEALKSNWDKFQTHHESLFKSRSPETKKLAYFTDDLYAQCEDKFLDAHGIMLNVLDDLEQAATQNVSISSPLLNATAGSHSRRLPRIDLPKFSGDYSKWSHFRDLFVSMIHSSTDLSDVEKLHYLKMSLSGEPSTLLKHIEISSEGFTRAWEALSARYENKRILIDAQLAALFSIRKVKSDTSSELKRLLCELKEAVGALAALDCPVQHWDLILVFMAVRRFDTESLKDWGKSLGASSHPPSFADCEKFLLSRILALEAFERTLLSRKPSSSRPSTNAQSYSTAVTDQKCALCSAGHYISSCPKYVEKAVNQRKELVVSKNLCFNCLGPHHVKACRTTKRCRICHKQHHSTLHASANNPTNAPAATPPTSSTTEPASTSSTSPSSLNASVCLDTLSSQSLNGERVAKSEISGLTAQSHSRRNAPVLLATALVTIASPNGAVCQARALLDQGSEASFLSESVAQLLKLPRRAAAIPIIGIGAQRTSTSNGLVSFKVISRVDSTISLEVNALILPKLTAYLPPARIERQQWPHLQDLQLADPQFDLPGQIDLILGASVYAQILKDGVRRGHPGEPIAQRTSLGWILSGSLSNKTQSIHISEPTSITGLQCSLDAELLDLLQRFWLQEEISRSSSGTMNPDESACEEHFQKTHSRDVTGRFTVRLPFKESITNFGDSRTLALKVLHRMEKRFDSNPSLKSAYVAFLTEYRELGHMSLLDESTRSPSREFFLPHHGVIRETSSTTKLRVVFNGSQKTSLGFSLNDCLHVGPKLQTDLSDIILRWRRHRYVFATDIEKMYRQIRVHESDWPFQTILWRDSSRDTVQSYRLCTVTYGLACAPYLALRCLQQLACDSDSTHKLASEILRRDTYVDDILSGADNITQAKIKILQLIEVLKAGGFTPKKWIANEMSILSDVPAHDCESLSTLSVNDDTMHYALGIQWTRQSDHFVFSVLSLSNFRNCVTKRSVLSFIARIFDPLGWIAPIVITAKIFIQELWAIRLDWDEELPDHLQSQWTNYIKQFDSIATLSVPRWIGITTSSLAIEIHGFADASQRALAAVIYLRVLNSSNDIQINLICAKTKVAPLKRLTTPRLELSAAVLLTRQVLKIREVLDLQKTPIHLWTDSSVALTWIKSHPSRWKEFVQNRVSLIQELSNSRWHHVPGKDNPADLASRGVSPSRLQQEQLWWTGPLWLQKRSSSWPSSVPTLHPTDCLEERAPLCATSSNYHEADLWDLIERFSSLSSLLRITAWIFRALQGFRKSIRTGSLCDPLKPSEIESALLRWTKLTQQAYFPSEINLLKTEKSLSTSSSLFRLMPFLDSDGLLRLRGRLQHSHLEPSEKHPLILPRNCRLTELVIDHHHRRTLHGGPQLTLSSIRKKFWIIGGRVPIRSFIRRCVICTRQRATTGQQIIGQLPASRVIPCRPFFHTGVDYAGPLTLKTFRGRGHKSYKGYFVIFVCFSTSAIHLEAVTDYSTDAFIAAFKRFTGRRGICSTITSDCGTNLIGADAELKRMFTASSQEWTRIANLLANDGVTWKFNPPSAPHFGGKWEAGVKSVKFHLRRVIGDTLLTYEELSTLLIQIEAILNSRPLSALSDDPADLSALSPGHFLVGSALNTIPEPSYQDLPQTRLSRWQLLRQMTESFWQRWSSEYLHQLQTSSKWHRTQEPFRKGALVLIKDERFPPLEMASRPRHRRASRCRRSNSSSDSANSHFNS